MKFLPAIGALVCLVLVQVVMHFYGTTGGVIALVLMLSLWWGSYVWKERVMDRLWHELNALSAEKRIEVLSHADNDFRGAMAKRDRKMKPNQPPENNARDVT